MWIRGPTWYPLTGPPMHPVPHPVPHSSPTILILDIILQINKFESVKNLGSGILVHIKNCNLNLFE